MSVYSPADSGLPAYFLPMLDDEDRNKSYSMAIKDTIARFFREQGRAPRVIDVGCGTGLLSILSLKHGAAHVTAVDTNKNMCSFTQTALEREGYVPKKQFRVVNGCIKRQSQSGVKSRSSFIPEPDEFDILVSEILGTVATSEGIFEHTSVVLPYLKKFNNQCYVIPNKIQVTAAVYSLSALYASMTDTSAPFETALDGILPIPSENGEVCLTSSQTTALPLHLLGAKKLSDDIILREDVYQPNEAGTSWREKNMPSGKFTDVIFGKRKDGGEGCEVTPAARYALDLRTVIVIEWKAELNTDDSSNAATIFNTIDGLLRLDARNAAARHAQWGFMFSRAAPPAIEPVLARGLKIKAGSWDKGIPKIFVKTIT